MSGFIKSKYFTSIQNDTDRRRYEEKLVLLGCGEDPYFPLEQKGRVRSSECVEWIDWPSVSYADIYNYLINTPSEYTHEMLKAYKSMDGYNFFVNGWVSNVVVTQIEGRQHYLFTATVKHSQTLSATPLKVWVGCKSNGEVVAAHCTCMAGIGEACSHIAAVLFAAEANTQVKQQQSCTSLPCAWLPPSFRSVEYLSVSDIDFRTPKQKRKSSQAFGSNTTPVPKKSLIIQKPTESELTEYYLKLSKTKHKPVLLSLVNGFNDDFVPLYVKGILPQPLTALYDQKYEEMPFPEIIKACEALYDTVTITPEQANTVELKTRGQSKCKLWYEQRAGHITASILRKVLHTDFSKPSVSLLKSICYPQTTKFFSEACEYGQQHEADALHIYSDNMKSTHPFFELQKSGLVLDTENPFIGASPDGIISCSCCGKGVVEVKCPFSCRDKSFSEAVNEKTFCLAEGTFFLKKDHAYFFQVQMQMKLCQVKFCDFVVWGKDGPYLTQRIKYDEEFTENALVQVKSFVKLCLLPELLSRCFTSGMKKPDTASDCQSEEGDDQLPSQDDVTVEQSTSTPDLVEDEEDNGLWCYCRQDEHYDAMIACDSESCTIEWFHLSCVNLTQAQVPSGNWYCPDCAANEEV